MTTATSRTPGMIRTAQEYLDTAGIYDAFHVELLQAYERPETMFREVTYGAGRQVIPRYSAKAFVQYIQLLEFLIKNQDLIEDEELHHSVVLVGSAGILGPKHLAKCLDISEGLIRRFTYKPHKGIKPRMGGTFNPDALWLVKNSMMRMLRDGDADYVALKRAKEEGISITLLSRLTGISAQALGRRFRKITNTEVSVDHPGNGGKAITSAKDDSTSSVESIATPDTGEVSNRPVTRTGTAQADAIYARARERFEKMFGSVEQFINNGAPGRTDVSSQPVSPGGTDGQGDDDTTPEGDTRKGT